MSGSAVALTIAAVGFLGFAGFMLARLPFVWRGGTMESLPWRSFPAPAVDHRTFPVATAFIGSDALLVIGAALVALTHARVIGMLIGLVAVPLTAISLVLFFSVASPSVPGFLIPPSQRP